MIRALALALALFAAPAAAQEGGFTALARLDPINSRISDARRDGLEMTLYLSQPVPWRIFTLDDPMRLVVDFREVDWRGATPEALSTAAVVSDLRFGALRPGWSRMVLDLARPLRLETAEMAVDPADGTAILRVALTATTAEDYAARAGAPPDPGWDALMALDVTAPPPAPAADGPLVVVIDPGHGGLDPGAERGGLNEAGLMLQLARELADEVNRTGEMRAVLTREADVFVPLSARISLARAAGADVLISLHADALEEDAARGATIYTLTAEADGRASQRMAERHERGDLLAGLDLQGQDDTVATVLMDLARLETRPQTERLAEALVAGLRQAGARVNNTPRRQEPLAVLNAADFPSVLLEAGFLSDAGDREALNSAEGRARIVQGVTAALQLWAADERERAARARQ